MYTLYKYILVYVALFVNILLSFRYYTYMLWLRQPLLLAQLLLLGLVPLLGPAPLLLLLQCFLVVEGRGPCLCLRSEGHYVCRWAQPQFLQLQIVALVRARPLLTVLPLLLETPFPLAMGSSPPPLLVQLLLLEPAGQAYRDNQKAHADTGQYHTPDGKCELIFQRGYVEQVPPTACSPGTPTTA